MNREIEFRAWDKKDRVIRDVVGISFPHESVSVDIGGGEYLQDNASRFDLMQYTGLKDIKGTEIFEGYIIKHTDNIINLVTVAPVYRKRGSLLFDVRVDEFTYEVPIHSIHMDDDRGYKDTLEVIGNIHEHNHLLGGVDE